VQRPKDGSDVTGFGSFDNSTRKRILDLLEQGDLRLGQVVIKRVAVRPVSRRISRRPKKFVDFAKPPVEKKFG